MNKEKIDDILGTFLLANIPEIITQEEFDDVKSAIKDLQKKAELGEHYKHLYSELKKQKDDVVKAIKGTLEINNNYSIEKLAPFYSRKWVEDTQTDLLRMLGEIDVEDYK